MRIPWHHINAYSIERRLIMRVQVVTSGSTFGYVAHARTSKVLQPYTLN